MKLRRVAFLLLMPIAMPTSCNKPPVSIKAGTYQYTTSAAFAADIVCKSCPEVYAETDLFQVIALENGMSHINAQGIGDEELKTLKKMLAATGEPRMLLAKSASTQRCQVAFRGAIFITQVGEIVEGAIGREEGKMCGDNFVYECSCLHAFTAKRIREV